VDLVPRTVIILAFVVLIARAVGKRELSSLEPFDVIMLVVIGDLVQQGITQNDDSVTGTIIVLSTLALVVVGLSYLNLRVPWSRKALDGEPVVLVVDGEVVERNMLRERITTDDLMSEARRQQLSSLTEVRWAILETSGKISFIPKQQS
jgi:uncharacterized membrane protein YcaP (DUF421 family)